MINFFCNLVPALIFWPLLGPTQRLLDRFWPATAAEDFAKLKYLHPQALSDPETTIDLIEKEQMRLLTRLPDYVNALRPAEPGKSRAEDRAMHHAFQMLFKEVQAYLATLFHEPLSRTTSERLTNVHDRQGVIGVLEETVRQMVSLRTGIPKEKSKPLLEKIKSLKLKVNAQYQEDQIRVSGKSKDDLQKVIASLKAMEFELPLQFVNYR